MKSLQMTILHLIPTANLTGGMPPAEMQTILTGPLMRPALPTQIVGFLSMNIARDLQANVAASSRSSVTL